MCPEGLPNRMQRAVKVLVIDDDVLVRGALASALASQGHEVTDAENGKRGLEIFQQCPPDLLITDIIMPEQEGIETIVQIRKTNPDLPIVAISGGGRFGGVDFLRMARSLGADVVLEKPFTVEALLESVAEARALAQRRAAAR